MQRSTRESDSSVEVAPETCGCVDLRSRAIMTTRFARTTQWRKAVKAI
jgi:hypothetical protein